VILLRTVCWLKVSFMHYEYDDNCADSSHQEHDIEPPVVEVKLQLAEDFSNDGTVLYWHVHPHKQDHRHKVHSHDLGE
jgi:hypothetical protein